MTEKKKKQWLRAVEKLREYYKRYELDKRPLSYGWVMDYRCPFCNVARPFFEGDCSDCLWIIFEGSECEDLEYGKDTTKQRLARLDRWENKLREV